MKACLRLFMTASWHKHMHTNRPVQKLVLMHYLCIYSVSLSVQLGLRTPQQICYCLIYIMMSRLVGMYNEIKEYIHSKMSCMDVNLHDSLFFLKQITKRDVQQIVHTAPFFSIMKNYKSSLYDLCVIFQIFLSYGSFV